MRKFILLLALLMIMGIQTVRAGPIDAELIDTYMLIREASLLGYNTTHIINDLNNIINETANFNKPLNLHKLENIKIFAREILNRHSEKLVSQLIAYLILTIFSLLMIYFTVKRRISREFWIKYVRNGVIKVIAGGEGSVSDEAKAVLLAVMLILIIFLAAYSFYRLKPYSGIVLLNDKFELSNYPSKVNLGQEIKLYVLVENHMNEPTMYLVKGKLDNGSLPINPSPAKPFLEYYLLLNNGSSGVIPVSLSINRTGRFRLIIELWTLDHKNKNFTYDGKWVQLWVEVNG